MARRRREERDVTFQELKALLFRAASSELNGYISIREKSGDKIAETQRQRYVALFKIIDDANLNEEFRKYQTMTIA